jgi:plasmid stability protein
MTIRTTVRLPEDLMRRVKRKAAMEGRSMTELIEDGLRRVLKDTSLKPKHRVLPPVSSASGGLMPGVDLNNSAALQEMDDVKTVRRLR